MVQNEKGEAAVERRYGSTAQTLHWLTVALMVFVVPAAWYMLSLAKTDPARADWHVLHKSVGILILALCLIRLVWRQIAPPPPMIGHRSPLEKYLAESAHWALYAVLLIMPISGYVGSVAGGHPISLFGVLPLPDLVPADKAISQVAERVHVAGQWAVYGLVGLHVFAAFYHTWVRKVRVLHRMLPRWLAP